MKLLNPLRHTSTKNRGRLACPALRVGVVMAVVGLFWRQTGPGPAQTTPIIRMKETVMIDTKGDAGFAWEVKLPAALYTNLKKNNPNVAVLLRKIGVNNLSWYQVEDIKGNFEDGTSTVHISCTTRGVARIGKDHFWESPLRMASMPNWFPATITRPF